MARLWALLALLLLATAPRPVRADDGAVLGRGGAIAPMKEHPSIRMVSERVVVDLTVEEPDVVDCLFRFRNEGPATTVRMGFPESSDGTSVDPRHPHGFIRFESWVDGAPVPTRVEGLKGSGNSWERWRTKSVHFAAGQTRLVRVRYSSYGGRVSDGSRSFSYRLDTGASWKGSIGRAEVVVRLGGLTKGYRLDAVHPAGARRKGDTLSWRWDNLEPAARQTAAGATPPGAVSGVDIWYLPGYREIVLDGRSLSFMEYYCYPFLEGSQLWASLDGLCYWLRGSMVGSQGEDLWGRSYQAATLLAHDHTLRVRAGSRRAMLDGKPIRLRHAPRMHHRQLFMYHEQLFVPINEVVALLGGASWYDAACERTFLFLKTARPRAPYAFLGPMEWVVRGKAELRRAERTAGASESWRQNPALAVTAGPSLPARLREKDAVRKAQPGGAGKPDATITAGTERAEMTILERTAKTARVRVAYQERKDQFESVYLLERPFGRWWYVVGIAPQVPEGVRPD
jgi:hypothetical protein